MGKNIDAIETLEVNSVAIIVTSCTNISRASLFNFEKLLSCAPIQSDKPDN